MPMALADAGEVLPDDAVADDAERRALELAPDPRLRRPADAVGGDRIGDAAGEIDDQPEPELRDRRREARRCARDENAVAARGRHVDVADVDGAAQEGDELGRALEDRGETRRLAVRDDDLAALPVGDQRLGVEHPPGRVDDDLRHLPERRDGALAVVVAQHVGAVRQERLAAWRSSMLWRDGAAERHLVRPDFCRHVKPKSNGGRTRTAAMTAMGRDGLSTIAPIAARPVSSARGGA